MPVIDTPAGTLEVTNAILSASEFRATQKISVSNSAPTKNFSVGDKFHVSTTDADAVNITGNLVAQKLKIGNLLVSPTFDLAAVSNVGNTTSNTLQFANATTSFVASSNVEIGGNITLTSNAQVKVGSNVLAEYTGPHGREPKEVPLKKYPEIAFDASKLDGNDTTNTYTQAGYTVTSSSVQSGYPGHEAFNGKINTDLDAWRSLALYTTGTGAYSVSTNSVTALDAPSGTSTTYNGEWLQIQMPKSIKLSHFVLHSQGHATLDLSSRLPGTGVMVGSTDGSTWYLLKRFVNISHRDRLGTKIVVDTNTTSYYKYFRILAEKTSPDGLTYDTDVAIGELELYGYKQLTTTVGDLSLDTTLKSTFNSVQSNNYVMYFDGKDPDTGNVPKYLPSDSVKSITPNNVVFDATNNCWTLDGSTESNVTTGSLGLVGDVPHTVSMWVNTSNLNNNVHSTTLFSLADDFSLSLNNDKRINDFDFYLASNTWNNITYTNEGRDGYRSLYCNGKEVAKKQNEDTHGLYPPFPILNNDGVGGYMITASSVGYSEQIEAYPPWEAFNHAYSSDHGDFWCSQEGVSIYNSSGDYIGQNSSSIRNLSKMHGGDGTGVSNGEWIMMEAPYKLSIYGVYLRARSSHESRAPGNFIVYGSNDPISGNWDAIFTVTGATPSAGNLETNGLVGGTNYPGTDETSTVYGAGKGKGYRFIALVTTKTAGNPSGDQCVMLAECAFVGNREGDLTRFPEPTRVLKYPHIAMRAPAQRGYVASASSTQTGVREAWNAFDGGDAMEWRSSGADYTGSDGIYVGTAHRLAATDTDGAAIPYGEWLQIKMPNKILLQSIKLVGDTGFLNKTPEDFKLYGSTNGSTWKLLITQTGLTPTTGGNIISPASALSVRYDYYALVTTKLFDANQTDVAIEALEFYGTQEDTGTPARVGPFDGKVANFRVYDQYLGDERIQEIYDAQKDAFGHKKSSMTFYKGRIGVGTTEPEGALTVVDENKTLERFPARAVSANDSYIEGQGQFNFSSAVRGEGDFSDTNAWASFSSGISILNPPRNTRLSHDTDYGAWIKMKSPTPINVKSVKVGGNRAWQQIGADGYKGNANQYFGNGLTLNEDGTRVAVGTINASGTTFIYDWSGKSGEWDLHGEQTILGLSANRDGYSQSLSGDGKYIAVGGPHYNSSRGRVRVFAANIETGTASNVPTWTQVGTELAGVNANTEFGFSVSLDRTGETLAVGEYKDDTAATDHGRVTIWTRSGSTWTLRATIIQDGTPLSNQIVGWQTKLSQDGQYMIHGGPGFTAPSNNKGYVAVWKRNADESWSLRQAFVDSGNTRLGMGVGISNGGTYICMSAPYDATRGSNTGRVDMYKWDGSSYVSVGSEYNRSTDDDHFGQSCDLSADGHRLVIGAGLDDMAASNSGRVYSFEWDGNRYNRMRPHLEFDDTGTVNSYLGNDNTSGVRLSADGSAVGFGLIYYDGNRGKWKVFGFAKNVKGVWGSNDDINWTKLTNETKIFGKEGRKGSGRIAYVDYDIDTNDYYKYHAIVADNHTQLTDTSFHGFRKQESSTLHDGNLTLTKNLDVPRIGPPLDADDTPRRDRLVVEYNTHNNPLEDGVVRDTSGRGLDGVLYGGASYDATEKALTFDAVTGTALESGILPLQGDASHSYSFWFNRKINGDDVLVSIATSPDVTNSASTMSNFYVTANGGGSWFNIQNDTTYPANTFTDGTWFHVVCIYKGGGASPTYKELYVNGIKITLSQSGHITSGDPLNFTNPTLSLGGEHNGRSNYYFNGSISNFKLYDTALTASEVKTLYNMGRCDEGGHVVNFNKTRVGIGLGDGEAPQAALDVRGENVVFNPQYESGRSSGRVGIGTSSPNSAFNFHQGTVFNGGAVPFGGSFSMTAYNPTGERENVFALFINSNNDLILGGGYNHDGNLWGTVGYFTDQNTDTHLNNFTGQHRTFIKDVPFSQVGELEGLIVSSDQNKYIKMSGGIEAGSNAITTNESLPIVSLSNVVTDKKCFGVISASEDPEERSDAFGSFVTPYEKEKGDTRVYINSVGEGAIWVSNIGGNLESGDYITTSNIAGYGQKQDGAGLMNYTVAKITMDCDFEPVTQHVQVIKKDEEGENILDEHGQIQWEDHPTETEKAYKIRYLDADGNITDEANAVHKAAFVGCTYHCG
jgi:hypothetical protein